MLARAAIRNPWVFRDFLPGAAGAEGAWDGGRYWPSVAEVDAAAASYAAMAAAVGTKPKFVAFHERNFERCGGASAMTRVRCGALRLTLCLAGCGAWQQRGTGASLWTRPPPST